MEEIEEVEEITYWENLKNLINKNKKTQGIALIISGIIMGYIATAMFFLALFKSHGLATAFLLFSGSLTIYATFALIANGEIKIEDFYKEKKKENKFQ